MRTIEIIRAEMRSTNDQLTAKIAELNGAGSERITAIQAEYDGLMRGYDVLAAEERSKLAEARSAHLAAPAPTYGQGARATATLSAERRAGMLNALMHRANPSRNPLVDAGYDYRGHTLLEFGREVLQEEGVAVRGISRSEIATRSLMSTSDFPQILANVASKTLRDAYSAAPSTFKPFSKAITLKDYRPSHRLQLGSTPTLLPLTENGEYKRGSMNEGGEAVQLNSYGRVVGITRQVIINDDLGAFTDLPEAFGTSAATLESDLVWGLILSNPVLATDGTAVFSVGHRNVATGGQSALSASAISAGRVEMSKQTDLSNTTILNLKPKYAAVPPELEVAIGQVLFPITPNTTAAAVPDFIRSLTPISEPRLSLGVEGQGGSATAWYMFSDPGVAETVVYATMDGQDGPYTETRTGFDYDGIEVKCRHDFGAAFTDYRGAFRSAGA